MNGIERDRWDGPTPVHPAITPPPPPRRQGRHYQDATVASPHKDLWNTHRCPNLVADYGMGIVRKRTESHGHGQAQPSPSVCCKIFSL